MNDDNKASVSPSRPLICSARRIRATIFLSESEARLLYEFATGTDSFPELNALCEKLEKMALDCLTAHNIM